MIKNYLRTALRNLVKNKIFSFINIFGLAAGLTCCMLISSFVYDELNYDSYPKNARQIYRVGVKLDGNGDVAVYPHVDVAVGEGIKSNFPEVQSFTRVLNKGEAFVKYEDKQFKEQKLCVADANFLQTFSIPFLEGDANTALIQPNSIVVTKAFGEKYFGKESATGKTLTIANDPYKVTGVIDKVPDNSHFHFDAFMSMASIPRGQQTWSNVGFYTYLVLNKDADPKKLEAKFPELVAKYVVPEVQHDMGVSLAEAQKSVSTFRFFLQPLASIHLNSNTKYELEANGDMRYVYIFGALALFILLLACVNFTNLSTASSSNRSREVGIRKVMGSLKKQLIGQFLTESVLLSFFSVIVAYLLVFTLLPFFNQLAGKNIGFSAFLSLPAIIAVLGLCLVVGIFAGIYPAFFLSSFNTISVLKSSSPTQGGRKSILRSGLVVFQFFVSTALIIATLIVYKQLHYMQEKKPGFDAEQVVYLPDTRLLGNSEAAFRQQLLENPHVVKVSMGRSAPGNGFMAGTQIYPKNLATGENGKEIHTNIYFVDYDYISTLGMQVVKGRNFSKDFATDSSGVLINEAAVKDLGWADTDPIGKTIVRSGQIEYTVVGVVADFNYASAKQKIAPLMMLLANARGGMIAKMKTADLPGLISDMKAKWDGFKPDGPFGYYFLDEKFAALYAAEQKTGQIFSVFAIVAVIIACLGLFGLAAFITEQRKKEIGIRKVLGASVSQVLVLVSREFLSLVAIAFVISVPVAWWAMNMWLQDFAYRINIAWWIFLPAGIIALVVAAATVSFQSIRAAVSNPVKSLRTE